MSVRHYFLSSLRRGFAAAITQAPTQGHHAEFDVNIRVKARRISGSVQPAQTARMRVGLYGPGDVRGLVTDKKTGQVVAIGKRHPAPGVGDFEPNFFPFVEFHNPDFAWTFSPDAMRSDGRLAPWLTLVVLRARARDPQHPAEFTEGERGEHDPLPWIRVDAGHLPDPAQVWRWTHVQIDDTRESADAAPTQAQLVEILEHEPWRIRCRCLCPRRLLPGSEYRALLVPTFELGRLAGRGLEPAPNVGAMDRAWNVNSGSIELPYYDAWSFRTGSRGDFEHAVSRLTIRQLSTVKLPAFDGSQPGFGLPSADPNANHRLEREGALRPAGSANSSDRAAEQFRNQLAQLLDQSGGARLTPPLYGRWHAARDSLNPKSDNWFDELNLDPRYRAAAALGAQVVRRNQSALMSSAWDQLGELDITEELLRRAWLAREAMAKLYARLLALPIGAFLSATGSMQSRVRVDCGNPGAGLPRTVTAALRERAVPAGCFDPALRRLAARYARKRGQSGGGLDPLVPAIIHGQLHAADPEPPAAGALHVDLIARNVGARLAELCKNPDSLGALVGLLNRMFNGGAQPPSAEVIQLANQLRKASCEFESEPPDEALPELPAEDVRAALECGLDAERNVAQQYQAATGLPLGPVLAHPVFPQPLYEQLREISTKHLLPTIAEVPPNTVAALETNRCFVEAFLCGANHELARELLWRGYPTDQRGSYFRQFWDIYDRLPEDSTDEAAVESLRDVQRLHEWQAGLGEHPAGDVDGNMVLLIRGDLLHKYPDVRIYAIDRVSKARHEPSFYAEIPPDMHFLGFDFTIADALGDGEETGKVLVFEERTSEQRFGLDEPVDDQPNEDFEWSDLNWAHVQLAESGYPEPMALTTASPEPSLWTPTTSAAVLAAKVVAQKPVRVLIHPRQLVGNS